ncbi:MAG: DUF5107 domain-containing protein [Candidatus Glassbacteria bacterium]|nr:DUF5107 domain-containing protein [Candidatus Glassbacteria bacterium]
MVLSGPGFAQIPPADSVIVYEGTVELDSYEFSGREIEPPLFDNSTISGKYPLPPFRQPYKPGGPKPAEYKAIFIENRYLRVAVVPDFGGRVYSLYDKVNRREVFYKNDVLKFSGVNSKHSWPVGNIELTGPYDTHMITLYGEPLWFNKVLRHGDGSVSLVMSNIDPFYRMKVNFTARLVPGLAAMELSVFCYNRRDFRRPYMFWVNGSTKATEGSRFVYPMTRTIGHTTSEVAGWPYYSGVDYSWIKNNEHMLGVFGIDIYDNYLGSYDYDLDCGTFRFADRRVVQGMKTWTWGWSRRGRAIRQGYTDNSGPYMEIQSGRYVWDGHYEFLAPHGYEGWSEWWFPVSGIGGLTTTSLDAALNLEVEADPKGKNSKLKIGISANRDLPGAAVVVSSSQGVLLSEKAHLAPGKPFVRQLSKIAADSAGLAGLRVVVTGSGGAAVVDYTRPDTDPGRKEYTPFTEPLDKPFKSPGQMTPEEQVILAETMIKEMKESSALSLLRGVLEQDEGYSRAHLDLGIYFYETGRVDSSLAHLERVIERDPYADEAYYYLALGLMERQDSVRAERSLYYISRTGSCYHLREYMLGRLAFLRGDFPEAETHLREAVRASGYNLSAGSLLAMLCRLQGRKPEALALIGQVEEIDPTDRWAAAERAFTTGLETDRQELLRLLGGQSQEAIELATVYRKLMRFGEALEVLKIVEENNRDIYGTPPVFYYTMAHCLMALGENAAAESCYLKARQAGGNLDRWPFREESIRPLAEAVIYDPSDELARFQLGCLLYFLGRSGEAIQQWEAGVEASPDNFSLRRTLGLAYAEQGYGIELAAAQLEKAIGIDPGHIRTFSDLSELYSRAGRFEEQSALLERALQRSPGDDYLIEGLFTIDLVSGDYRKADSLIHAHEFTQRHRHYGLRDKYRFMRYGMAARACQAGDYQEALRQYEMAMFPPSSLGADDFQYQMAPRLHYYQGMVYRKLGKEKQAIGAFESGITGWQQLSGDRDSFNSENFYIVLSMMELGRRAEAEDILRKMENFARGQFESRHRNYRSEARYLAALAMKARGEFQEAAGLFEEALDQEPQMLGPRLELRGDVPDPLPQAALKRGD